MDRSDKSKALSRLLVVQVRGLKTSKQYNGVMALKLKEDEEHVEVWLCGGPFHGKMLSMRPQNVCERLILGPTNIPEKQKADRFCGICMSDPVDDDEATYWECCGKYVCAPCMREYFFTTPPPRRCVYCRELVPKDWRARYDRCLERLWKDGNADAAFSAATWLPEDDETYDAQGFALSEIAAGLGNPVDLFSHVQRVRFLDCWNSLRQATPTSLVSGNLDLSNEDLGYFGSRVLECNAILDHLLRNKHLDPDLHNAILDTKARIRKCQAAFDRIREHDRLRMRPEDHDKIHRHIQSILNVQVPYDATSDIAVIGYIGGPC